LNKQLIYRQKTLYNQFGR